MRDDRYPVGAFKGKESYSGEEIESLIKQIEGLPDRLEATIKGFSQSQLDTPYRTEGWTVRQVIHHVADSHMNAYIRMKWTLTENRPIIKAYDEKAWAETPETKLDVELSLHLIKSLHVKWTALIRSFSDNDLKKEFIHPETNKAVSMMRMIALYAWHGNHHLAHITTLKEKKGWN